MAIKRIVFGSKDKKNALSKAIDMGTPFFERVCAARGFSLEDLDAHIHDDSDFSDPFLFKDMKKAVEALDEAISAHEHICIYGDYDADGVCSTAVLALFLRDMGANFSHYIPERSDGYGLNKEAIKQIADSGAELLITVDNGIVAVDEAKYAAELGLKLIITDHHLPRKDEPEAYAVVDPHREACESDFKDLSGAGVVFKLLSALEDGDGSMIFENYGELIMIATIADVMPLVGENRKIVREGLRRLEFTENIGLIRLMETLKINPAVVKAEDIAFKIAPIINSAGRMASANTALKLFLAESKEEADELIASLILYNKERKELERKIAADVNKYLNNNPKLEHDSVLLLASEGWNHGVIGISAARLMEKTGKPCFLLEISGVNAKGSGRGVADVSLTDLLTSCDDLLKRYGGHKAAAGLTMAVSNIEELRKRLNTEVSGMFKTMPVDEVTFDIEANPCELTPDNLRKLSVFEPFGEGNRAPSFLIKDVSLIEVRSLGDGSHSKQMMSKNGKNFEILCFGQSKADTPYISGTMLDIIVTADINEYRGKESAAIKAKYMQTSGLDTEVFLRTQFYFDRLMRGEKLDPLEAEEITPDREYIGKVYTYLKKSGDFYSGYSVLAEYLGGNYGKTRLAVMILKEIGIIEVFSGSKGVLIKICAGEKKADLSSSRLLGRLLELKK